MAYFDPTLSYDAGGMDRGTLQNLPSALWQRVMDSFVAIAGTTGRRLALRREWLKAADIASAGTTDLATVEGNFAHVTGTTTITAFGTVNAGTVMFLRFTGALTVTHNATSLILANGLNFVTIAGSVLTLVSEGGGNWREVARNQMGGAWTAFTPTVTQGAGVAITVDWARYMIVGKIAHVQISVASTAAGTGGQQIVLASIPAAIAPLQTGGGGIPGTCGGGMFIDSGAGYYAVSAAFSSATTILLYGGAHPAASPFGVAPAVTLASGDRIQLTLVYELG